MANITKSISVTSGGQRQRRWSRGIEGMSPEDYNDQPLPLVVHLTELRDKLLRALLAVLIMVVVLLPVIFGLVPIAIMAVYLTIAKRLGAFDAL